MSRKCEVCSAPRLEIGRDWHQQKGQKWLFVTRMDEGGRGATNGGGGPLLPLMAVATRTRLLTRSLPRSLRARNHARVRLGRESPARLVNQRLGPQVEVAGGGRHTQAECTL